MAVKAIAIAVRLDAVDAEKRLREIDREISKLTAQKHKLELDASKLSEAKTELEQVLKKIDETKSRIKELSAQKLRLQGDVAEYDEIQKKLQTIKEEMARLSNEKVEISFRITNLQAQQNALKSAIRQTEELINVQEKLGNYAEMDALIAKVEEYRNELTLVTEELNQEKAALQQVENAQKSLAADSKTLNARKSEIRANVQEYKKLEAELKRLQTLLTSLEGKATDLGIDVSEIEAVKAQLKEVSTELDRLDNMEASARVEVQGAREAYSEISALETTIESLRNKAAGFNLFGDLFSGIGDAMANPLKFLGANGNNLFGDILHTLTKGVVYSSIYRVTSTAMNTVEEGFSAGITRFDTLNRSVRNLGFMGIDDTTIQQQLYGYIDKAGNKVAGFVDDLTGLPTSLDQGIEGVTNLTAVMNNDLPKARKVFNALNDGILGFGGSAEDVSRAIQQLSETLGQGYIDAQTFNSLRNAGLMPALQQVEKMLGLEEGTLKTEVSKGGSVSTDQLLDALITLDEQGYGTFQSLRTIVKSAMNDIDTQMANAKTAVARGVAEIVTSLNTTLEGTKWGSIAGFIQTLASDAESGLKGLASAITNNQGTIQDFFDMLYDGYQKAKEFVGNLDFGSFFKGFSESAMPVLNNLLEFGKGIVNVIAGISNAIGNGNTAEGFGKFITEWFKTAYMFKIAGGLFKTVGKGLDSYATFLSIFASKKIAGGQGIFSKIASFFGKGSSATQATQAVTGAVTSANTMSSAMSKFDSAKFLSRASNLALIGGAAIDIMLFAQAIKQIDECIPEDVWSERFGLKVAALAVAIGGMTAITEVINGINTGLNKWTGGMWNAGMAATILELAGMAGDMMLFAEAIKQVDEKVPTNFNDIAAKLTAVGEVAAAMGVLCGVIGGLEAQFPIVAVAELLGTGTMAALAAELILWAEAMKEFNDKCPSDFSEVSKKLGSLMEAATALTGYNWLAALSTLANIAGVISTGAVAITMNELVAMAEAMQKLDDINVSSYTASKVDKLKEVAKTLVDEGWWTTLTDSWKASNEAGVFNNVEKIFSAIAGIAENANKLNDLPEIDKARVDDFIDSSIPVIRKVAASEVPDIPSGWTDGTIEQAIEALGNVGKLIPAIKTMMDNTNNIQLDEQEVAATLSVIGKVMSQFSQTGVDAEISSFVRTSDVDNAIAALDSIMNMVTKLKELQNYKIEAGNELQNIRQTITNLKACMSAFSSTDDGNSLFGDVNVLAMNENAIKIVNTAMRNIINIAKKIDEIKGIEVDVESVKKVAKNVYDAAVALLEISTAKSATGVSTEADGINLQSIIESLDDVIIITEKASQIAGTSIDWTALTDTIPQSLTKMFTAWSSVDIGSASAHAVTMQALLNKYSSMLDTIKNFSTDYNDAGVDWANNLLEGYQSVEVEDAILDLINGLISDLGQKAGEFKSIGTSYGSNLRTGFFEGIGDLSSLVGFKIATIASQANLSQAANAGTAIANAINTAFTATLDLSSGSSGTSGTSSSKTTSPGVTTKPVYRAEGGPVPAYSTGIDTVPAMLTAGEYVINRQAVQTIGQTALSKINRMDIIGAYRAMTNRFGQAQSMNSVTNHSIINNDNRTYADNRSVTIVGNSDDRGLELKAGRYLRAI